MPATLPQVKTRIRRASGDDAQRLQAFADGLFSKADDAFLNDYDPDALYAMAKDGLSFLDALGTDPMRLQVFNPSDRVDGWESPYTVVRLALRDRPFIVDSVRAALKRHGFELAHVLHPTYAVARDDEGHLVSLSDRHGVGEREAFEMYFIGREDDEQRLETLRGTLARVLGDVILATDDYAAMRARAAEVAAYLRRLRERSAQGPHRGRGEELEEYAGFLEWLDDDNFVYLGFREYDLHGSDDGRALQVTPGTGLGVLRKVTESAYREPVAVSELSDKLRERVLGGGVVVVTKTNAEATVHKSTRMDYVGVKKLGDGWDVQGELRFIGLLTSKAHLTATDQIPVLRRKLRKVIELDGCLGGSHDYKKIVEIFNSMPRPDLFWAEPAQLLKEIRAIMSLEEERGVRLTVRPDPLARGLAVMVVMPRDRFNAHVRRRIQAHLAEVLRSSHVDYQLAMGEDEEQTRLHFFFTTDVRESEVDVKAIESEVAELTRTWEDHLRQRLIEVHGGPRGRELVERYVRAFDDRYMADTSAGRALRDIEQLEAVDADTIRVDMVNPVDDRRGENVTLLRVYHPGHGMVLSDVLPLLENVGFRVLEQVSYVLDVQGAARGIEVFKVQDQHGNAIDLREAGSRLVDASERLLAGQGENDRLNRLVLYAGLDLREVALLRAYQMYYGQLNAVVSRRFINETLLSHPRVAWQLFTVFQTKFDPLLAVESKEERAARLEEVREAYLETLAEVDSLPEDQLLRGLLNLVDATLRTNYYQGRDAIALKFASERISSMPEPRPMFEIAIASPTVEGTHLRGGAVARGGIRWSDRPDDFRTEVLGLMKTQMTKNAVIVPVGSKGGFIVKAGPADRDGLRRHVEAQYRSYVGSLLDLTDNVVAGEVRRPERVLAYDDADTYLVVAADKGTATFSDVANAVAAERGFWLGDAFASGGSHGYDHKGEGITARSTWEGVKRHFIELGLDPMTEPFTVAGIGDMSGDVFGNGLLYTDRIKLLAAFNHQHVFVDPDPDPAVSFAERKRLFGMPRSSWRDYAPDKISAGGGVFDRAAKRVALTPEMQRLFGTDAETLSGQDLVRAVLTLEVDLLWNGGIGTYVKAGAERHTDVGDSANDGVRIDASELRAKVVGEGGNLGFTQLARVEYARAGGRINTDAIDNMGGVSMSDHEVNIKMLLQPLVVAGELSEAQRNRLLEEMTDDVSALVLRDGARQALALSLAQRRSRADVRLFDSLIEYLSERGGLDAQVEALPNRRAMAERERAGEGLTRPELAIVLAYVKMGLYRRLLETDVPGEPALRHYLTDYFPSVLPDRFPAAVQAHPLRREIAATQMTNMVVDLLGMTFVHRMIRDTGATPVEITRAALIALEVLAVEGLLERLEALGRSVPADVVYDVLDEQVRAVEGLVRWILLNDLSSEPVEAFADVYRAPLAALRAGLPELLPGAERRRYKRAVKGFVAVGMPEELAVEAASFQYLPSSLGVIEVARSTVIPLEEAARHFFALGERLSLGWLRDRLAEVRGADRWETIAVGGLVMDLREAQRDLTERFVRARAQDERLGVATFLGRYPNVLRRFDESIAQLREDGEVNLAAGGVVVRLLEQMREG